MYKNGEKPGAYKLCTAFTRIKYDQFPHARETPAILVYHAMMHVERAFKNFLRRKGYRFPRYKVYGVGKDVFSVGKVRVEENHIVLPKMGHVKMREGLRFQGSIRNATISKTSGRWFAGITVEIEKDDILSHRFPEKTVGIAFSLEDFAVCSDGTCLILPDSVRKNQIRMRRLARKMLRMRNNSRNREKCKRQINKIDSTISNIRHHAIHSMTTRLTKENARIVMQQVRAKELVENSQSPNYVNAGFYEFRRQLTYKAKLCGSEIVIADKNFPSKEICAKCGEVNPESICEDNMFRCSCGHVDSITSNAARNLERWIW